MSFSDETDKWSFPQIARLVPGLRVEVFLHLATTELINTSLTSKINHALNLPLIYCSIDIRETSEEHTYSKDIVEHRQCQLFHTLKEDPPYYIYIRSLLFFVGEPGIMKRIPPDSLPVSTLPELEEDSEADERWPVTWIMALHDHEHYVLTFLEQYSLAHVRFVDFFFAYDKRPPAQGFPEMLFPKATELQIGGMTDWALIKSLFHESITTPLSHLGIDMVRHRGFRVRDNAVSNSPLPPEILETISHFTTLTRRERFRQMSELQKGRRTPGPVAGILPLASPRCSSLTSLFIRKQGKSSHSEVPYNAYPDEADTNSLKSFIIQARINHGGGIHVGQYVLPGEETVMAKRIREIVLPVLVLDDWRLLERLTLNGCGVVDDESMRDQIWRACPELVEFSTTEAVPWMRVDSRWLTV